VQLAAALLFYQKELTYSRGIGIAFTEPPSLAGGFLYTKKELALGEILTMYGMSEATFYRRLREWRLIKGKRRQA